MKFDLQELLQIDKENENIEFKEAKNSFSFDELCKYISALSNEWWWLLVFWIKDKKWKDWKREIIWTNFKLDENSIFIQLWVKIKWNYLKEKDLSWKQKQILVIEIPWRDTGRAIFYKWISYMRLWESLKVMDESNLKKVFNEIQNDFSWEICKWLKISDLDTFAIDEMKKMYSRKVKNDDIINKTNEELLKDLFLIKDNKLTYASLILLWKREAINKFLPQGLSLK